MGFIGPIQLHNIPVTENIDISGTGIDSGYFSVTHDPFGLTYATLPPPGVYGFTFFYEDEYQRSTTMSFTVTVGSDSSIIFPTVPWQIILGENIENQIILGPVTIEGIGAPTLIVEPPSSYVELVPVGASSTYNIVISPGITEGTYIFTVAVSGDCDDSDMSGEIIIFPTIPDVIPALAKIPSIFSGNHTTMNADLATDSLIIDGNFPDSGGAVNIPSITSSLVVNGSAHFGGYTNHRADIFYIKNNLISQGSIMVGSTDIENGVFYIGGSYYATPAALIYGNAWIEGGILSNTGISVVNSNNNNDSNNGNIYINGAITTGGAGDYYINCSGNLIFGDNSSLSHKTGVNITIGNNCRLPNTVVNESNNGNILVGGQLFRNFTGQFVTTSVPTSDIPAVGYTHRHRINDTGPYFWTKGNTLQSQAPQIDDLIEPWGFSYTKIIIERYNILITGTPAKFIQPFELNSAFLASSATALNSTNIGAGVAWNTNSINNYYNTHTSANSPYFHGEYLKVQINPYPNLTASVTGKIIFVSNDSASVNLAQTATNGTVTYYFSGNSSHFIPNGSDINGSSNISIIMNGGTAGNHFNGMNNRIIRGGFYGLNGGTIIMTNGPMEIRTDESFLQNLIDNKILDLNENWAFTIE